MGKTVFCIDDSPSIRMLVKSTLEPEGFAVRDAGNGQEALDALAKDPTADMFIVDVNMPVMDGFTFVEKLKKTPVHAGTPIVFLTTESGDDKKAQGKDLGVSGWVVKPFDGAQLVKLVGMLTG